MRTSNVLKPPYPLTLHGNCAGCGSYPVPLTRVYGPTVYRYRCDQCIKKGMVRDRPDA